MEVRSSGDLFERASAIGEPLARRVRAKLRLVHGAQQQADGHAMIRVASALALALHLLAEATQLTQLACHIGQLLHIASGKRYITSNAKRAMHICTYEYSYDKYSTHRFGRIAILLEFLLAAFPALQFGLCVGEGRVRVSKVAIEPKAVLRTRASNQVYAESTVVVVEPKC